MACKLLIFFLKLHDMFSCIVDKPKRNSKVSYTNAFPRTFGNMKIRLRYHLMFNVSNFGGKGLCGSLMFFL
jgi:hypothetical protein